MTRSYAACGSITFPVPNSESRNGTPACAPPVPLSQFEFDDRKGSCTVQMTQKALAACSSFDPGPCSSLKLKLKCRGVLNPGGARPTDRSGWRLALLTRATLDDPVSGDLTVIDAPGELLVDDVRAGKISFNYDTADFCLGGSGLCLPSSGPLIPACASMQLLGIRLLDPDGGTFAVVGTAASIP